MGEASDSSTDAIVSKGLQGYFDAHRDEKIYWANHHVNSIVRNFHPRRLLDLGCAQGYLVQGCRRNGVEAYGVDVSFYALSKAEEDVKDFLIRVDLDTEPIPFENEYFDFVTLIGTLEYLKDIQLVLEGIKRLVSVAGKVYLYTGYKKNKNDPLRANVHGRAFWVSEFAKAGFAYDAKSSQELVSEFFRSFIRWNPHRKTLRFIVFRHLFPRYSGRMTPLVRGITTRILNFDILLFEKAPS